MHTLTVNVIYATGLRREIAKAAIGDVLLFLRKELSEGPIAEFIARMPQARDAVDRAAAQEEGDGRSPVMILTEKLMELGLNETQIVALIHEIIARAKTLLSADDVAKVRQLLNGVADHLRATPRPPQSYPAPFSWPGRFPE